MKLVIWLLLTTMAAVTLAADAPEAKERTSRKGMKVKLPKGGKEKIKGLDKFPWGLYPLWRVHKYKGVSLRPVPIGGVPLPPPMPVAFPPMPLPAQFPPAFPSAPYPAPAMAPPMPSYSPAQPVSSYGPPPGPPAYGDSPLGDGPLPLGDGYSSPGYEEPPQQYSAPPPQQQYSPPQQYPAPPQQYSAPSAPPQQYSAPSAPPQQYFTPSAPQQYSAPSAPPQQYSAPSAPPSSAYGGAPSAYGGAPSATFLNGSPQGSNYGGPSVPFMAGPLQGSSYGALPAPEMTSSPQGSSYGAPPPGPAGGAAGYGDSSAPSFDAIPSPPLFGSQPSGIYGHTIDQGRAGESYNSPVSVPPTPADTYRSNSVNGPLSVSINDLPLANPSYIGPLPIPGIPQTLPDSYSQPSVPSQQPYNFMPTPPQSYAPGPSGAGINGPMPVSPYEGQPLNEGPVASSYGPGPGSYGSGISYPGPSSLSPVVYSVESYGQPPAQMFGSPSATWQDVPLGSMDMPSGSYGSLAGDGQGVDSSHFSGGYVSSGYEPAYSQSNDNGNPSAGGGKYVSNNFDSASPIDVGPTEYVRGMMQQPGPSMEQPFTSSDTYGNPGTAPMGY